MKKQLFISIPENDPAPVVRKVPFPDPEESEEEHKAARSIESISSDNSDYKHHKGPPLSHKYPLVEFEEFKIDQPAESRLEVIKEIDVDVPTPKEEVDHRNFPCKEPPAPSKGSSKTRVFAFPGQVSGRGATKEDSDLSKQLEECKKQLLFKDGQISMLQKFIAQHIGKQPSGDWRDALRILEEKDKKIGELLNKINHQNVLIKEINEQLASNKYQNLRLKNELSSLEREVFVLQRKSSNRQLTRDFYDIKKTHDTKAEGSGRLSLRHDPSKDIDELQKRLDYIKNNNIELEISKTRLGKASRESMWVSQTSTHKDKRDIEFRLETETDRRETDRRKNIIKHY